MKSGLFIPTLNSTEVIIYYIAKNENKLKYKNYQK